MIIGRAVVSALCERKLSLPEILFLPCTFVRGLILVDIPLGR
jgi:hypothetical protein